MNTTQNFLIPKKAKNSYYFFYAEAVKVVREKNPLL